VDSLYVFLFSEVASTKTFVVIVLLLLAYLVLKNRARLGITFALGAALMGATVWCLKIIFAVERIPGGRLPVDSYAFPSGHAAASAFLAVIALGYVQGIANPWQRFGLSLVTIGLAIAIGASRVVYTVHTPLQVLAGAIIGIVFGALTYALMKRVPG